MNQEVEDASLIILKTNPNLNGIITTGSCLSITCKLVTSCSHCPYDSKAEPLSDEEVTDLYNIHHLLE